MKRYSNMQTYDTFLNEGKDLPGTFSSLKDLLKAIKALPDTITKIEVPTSLSQFQPPSQKIIPSETKDWKKEVEKILKKTLKDKKGKEIDTFHLRSYYGTRKDNTTDPFYIQLSSEGSRQVSDEMSSGKHGKLD